MIILVISDIHANLAALKTVLEDAGKVCLREGQLPGG